MKSPVLRVSLLAFTLAAFSACQNPSKKHGNGGDDASLGGSGTDVLNPTDISSNPLPSRTPGFNPEDPGQCDYATLAAETIYFAFDSSNIAPGEHAKLDNIRKWLDEHADKHVLLAGHTDERGTLEYNRGLGERRANAVRNYLTGLGVDPARIQTLSYGEEKPAVQGHDEAAWSKNRRVQIGVILK